MFSSSTSRIGAAIGVLILCLVLAYCSGRFAGRKLEENAQLSREIDVRGSIGAADEKAADRRVREEITLAEQAKELRDATALGEDPSIMRLRRGCLILRQQGRDTSGIPECRGFESRPRADVSASGTD